MKKGQKVQVNERHHGLVGSIGQITGKTHKYGGHTYLAVRFTGGRGRGETHYMSAGELNKINKKTDLRSTSRWDYI